ncbi:unnamed protein product [Phytomonas sp. Hart1]|nr:unnamed protein product [Phytomonas sp. Hart1]|eukprot:CCW68667.1 unnamed protein product [Phytomonas sp. isolate Hart1]
MDLLSQVRGYAYLRKDAQFQTDNASIYTPPEDRNDYRKQRAIVSFKLPVSEIDKSAAETLDAFFKDIDELNEVIAEMKQITIELQNKHTSNLQTIDPTLARQLRSEIETLAGRCNEKISIAKGKLDIMSKKNEALKKDPETLQANTAIVRIQENQHRYLIGKLMEIMEIYHKVQNASETSYREHTKRQIKIMCKNSENTEIDDAAAEQLAQQVLDNNLNSYIFQQSKEVLASILETRNDIYRIEYSMRELNRVFNDMALLIDEQGELLDVIQTNVRNSARYVANSLIEFKKSRKLQKKINKKHICLFVIVLIILLLFVLIIIASTIPV